MGGKFMPNDDLFEIQPFLSPLDDVGLIKINASWVRSVYFIIF